MSVIRASRASALMTKESWEKPTGTEVKKLLQGVGVYSLGVGIGTSLGFAANKLVLPKVMKSLGPKERAILAGGIGVAAAMAAAAGTKRVFERGESGKGR